MRSRTILSALIFLALYAIKLYIPDEAARLRAYIQPAIAQEIPLSEDAEALGRAIAGGGSAQEVWSR